MADGLLEQLSPAINLALEEDDPEQRWEFKRRLAGVVGERGNMADQAGFVPMLVRSAEGLEPWERVESFIEELPREAQQSIRIEYWRGIEPTLPTGEQREAAAQLILEPGFAARGPEGERTAELGTGEVTEPPFFADPEFAVDVASSLGVTGLARRLGGPLGSLARRGIREGVERLGQAAFRTPAGEEALEGFLGETARRGGEQSSRLIGGQLPQVQRRGANELRARAMSGLADRRAQQETLEAARANAERLQAADRSRVERMIEGVQPTGQAKTLGLRTTETAKEIGEETRRGIKRAESGIDVLLTKQQKAQRARQVRKLSKQREAELSQLPVPGERARIRTPQLIEQARTKRQEDFVKTMTDVIDRVNKAQKGKKLTKAQKAAVEKETRETAESLSDTDLAKNFEGLQDFIGELSQKPKKGKK
jgi:hypothetical protein